MFYQYSIYAPKKASLEEIAHTLRHVFDFDPGSVVINRGATSLGGALARRLRLMAGVRDAGDWHMFITGPESRQNDIQVRNLVEKYDGQCDGGGYDFAYDPTGNYTDEQIYRYGVAWEAEQVALHRAYLASLTPEERAKVEKADQDLEELREAEMATARADRQKYGYAE